MLAAMQTRPGLTPHATEDLFDWTSAQIAASALFRATPLERIDLVRRGVPARFVPTLSAAMSQSKERIYAASGLPRATIDRKIRASQRLNPDESERIIGLARLIGQAHQMVAESGDLAGFDAARWVGEWLSARVAALGGRTPGEFLDTAEGRELVSHFLARQQTGAYS